MQVNSMLVNAGVYGAIPQPGASRVLPITSQISNQNLLQKPTADSISVSAAALQKFEQTHPSMTLKTK